MKEGIGNDIVSILRIRRALKRHSHAFHKKILTKKESEYCLSKNDPPTHIAGRFAAKEAIAKALGSGFGSALSFVDIEILSNQKGRPIATLSPDAQKIWGRPDILLSISHCKDYAIATALLQYTTRCLI